MRTWLSNISESWILIFDNADDFPLDISQYIPACDRGVILITTRKPYCWIYDNVICYRLGPMETEEAITLLLKASGVQKLCDDSAWQTAERAVVMLGYLALAIVQAGAFIRQHSCSMEEYCEIYARHRDELSSRGSVQGHENYRSVVAALDISLKKLEAERSDSARDAMELLQIISFLHNERIPEEVFHRAWKYLQNKESSAWTRSHQPNILLRHEGPEWEPGLIRKAVSLLSSYSLITRDIKNVISLHPLVHTWARDCLQLADKRRVWVLTVSMIAASIPCTFNISDYRIRQSIVPHVKACLRYYGEGVLFPLLELGRDWLSMASKFVLVYQENGWRFQALQLMETGVAVNKRIYNIKNPNDV